MQPPHTQILECIGGGCENVLGSQLSKYFAGLFE